MAKPDRPTTALVGVYPREHVPEALDALRRVGVEGGTVLVGDEGDAVTELRAEMQEEAQEGWIAPQFGVAHPKESAKGGVLLTVALAVIGGILFLPLAAIPIEGAPVWLRAIAAFAIGAFAGGAIGVVAGPALSVRRPNDPLAAERGVTVRVAAASPEVEQAMASAHPIRLDRLNEEGVRLSTVTTEEQERDEGVVEDMVDHVRHPGSDLRSPGEAPTPRDSRA